MKRGPPPQVVGCVGRQSAAPSWPSFPLQYLPRPASPRPPKPPHIFHLAAPAHKSCFRIKELGTIETGSGPADKWARPVKTVCRSLGARGPSASCHPIPTWWLTQVGPYDHEGIFQGHWATSWSTVGRSKRILSPRPFCLHPTVLCVCAESIAQLIPLCLQFCIPISPPWLQRASCDSRIPAKQFPRDGETALQLWVPPPLPSGSPPLLGSSTGSSCVLQNSLWITSVIASICGPQKHKGAMSSSFEFFFFLSHAWT